MVPERLGKQVMVARHDGWKIDVMGNGYEQVAKHLAFRAYRLAGVTGRRCDGYSISVDRSENHSQLM